MLNRNESRLCDRCGNLLKIKRQVSEFKFNSVQIFLIILIFCLLVCCCFWSYVRLLNLKMCLLFLQPVLRPISFLHLESCFHINSSRYNPSILLFFVERPLQNYHVLFYLLIDNDDNSFMQETAFNNASDGEDELVGLFVRADENLVTKLKAWYPKAMESHVRSALERLVMQQVVITP